MTSKNSCFDRAIFRRSLRRTAPVWGLFCLYELLLPLRLLSYRSVGTQAGILLALRCETVAADGRRRSCLAAFSPTPVSDGGNYDALTGGDG